MLEKILKLYQACMLGDVRSPLPHLFGPPGCGKSTVVEEAAELLGVNLHIINVSRISPLELEGIQMPVNDNRELNLLTATFWTQLQEGDILLLDEFLRGFPEVYNGLLDILTSRRVGGYRLPPVFIIAASNSTVAYDPALEDRLLHLPVQDPRHSVRVQRALYNRFVKDAGLHPAMAESAQIETLFNEEVMPTYNILDELKGNKVTSYQGKSTRNLLGQIKLREIQSPWLEQLLELNLAYCVSEDAYPYSIFPNAKSITEAWCRWADHAMENNLVPTEKTLRENFLMNMELRSLAELQKQMSQEYQERRDKETVNDLERDLFA